MDTDRVISELERIKRGILRARQSASESILNSRSADFAYGYLNEECRVVSGDIEALIDTIKESN